MNFFETIKFIEASLIDKDITFDLWDMQYARYVFGAWYADYRINGHHVMFYYNGREKVFGIQASERHEDYPSRNWQDVYYGTFDKFLTDGIEGLKMFLAARETES
jgi:hypothetical protein